MDPVLTVLIWLNQTMTEICSKDQDSCYTICQSLKAKSPDIEAQINSCRNPSGQLSPTEEIAQFVEQLVTLILAVKDQPVQAPQPDTPRMPLFASPLSPKLQVVQVGKGAFEAPITDPVMNTALMPEVQAIKPIQVQGMPTKAAGIPNGTGGGAAISAIPANEARSQRTLGGSGLEDVFQGFLSGGYSASSTPQIFPIDEVAKSKKPKRLDLKSFVFPVYRRPAGILNPGSDLFQRVSTKFLEKCRLGILFECS